MNKHKKFISAEFDDSFLNENNIIFKKYKPIKLIGKGAFSRIYSTIRISDKSVFAMKTEKKILYKGLLEREAYILFILREGFGIPKLISYGQNKKYHILIETLLGKSLQDIFIKAKKHCTLINICLIAIQLIERLEFIHSKNLIYRDIKPENLMIGLKDPNVLYIVDFGLCKKYRSSKTGKHILPKETNKFSGTLKYASSYVVQGKEASRRDDLISLGFSLIFLYKRTLPWESDWKKLNKDIYLDIIYAKETFNDGQLFENLPKEMVDFLKYTKNLRFEEDPDYTFMKGCFQKILIDRNLNINKIYFSWVNPNETNNFPRNNSSKRMLLRERILNMLESNSHSKNKNQKINMKNRKAITNNNIQQHRKQISNIPINPKIKKIINNVNNNKGNNSNKNDNIGKKHKNIKIEYPTYRQKSSNIRDLIYFRNKNNFNHKETKSLINDNEFINDSNKNVYQNIYINTNRNIYLNNISLKKFLRNDINYNIKYNTNIYNTSPKKKSIKKIISNTYKKNPYFNNSDLLNKPKIINNNIENTTVSFSNINNMNNNTYNNNINNFINKPKIYRSKILKNKNNIIINIPNINSIKGEYINTNINNRRKKIDYIPKPKTFRLHNYSHNF